VPYSFEGPPSRKIYELLLAAAPAQLNTARKFFFNYSTTKTVRIGS
jgi:hypothetical protein